MSSISEKMPCVKTVLMLWNFLFMGFGLLFVYTGIKGLPRMQRYMHMSTEFSDAVPYIFIALGATICAVCIFACFCITKSQPALLYLYGGYLGLIFIIMLGTGCCIYTYRTKLLAGFEMGLNDTMIHYRAGDPTSIADFDDMQQTLKCCGSHKSSDWLDLTPPTPVPLSCCIKPECDTAVEEEIYTQGCYDKVTDYMTEQVTGLVTIAYAIAGFPLIGLALACLLARSAEKARYQPMA